MQSNYNIHQLLGHIISRIMTGLTLTEAQVFGENYLAEIQKPYLLIMNHVSHWDPVEIWAYFPDFINFIVKEELHKIPIFGPMSILAGNIALKRDGIDIKATKKALLHLKKGFNLAVFIEGTRSYDGKISTFQESTIALANRALVPVIPLYIKGTFNILPKHKRLIRANPVKLYILKPEERTLEANLSKEAIKDITQSLEKRMKLAEALASQNCLDQDILLKTENDYCSAFLR